MEPKTKEFIWGARLNKENKMVKWSGRQDGVLEQIILKMAVLGSGAAKGERNLVEVTSFDSEQKKKKVLICSLGIDKIECQSLGDLSLFPPANFTLIEGSGPVEVVASHIILDEDDLSDEDDEEDFDESVEDLREKLKAKRVTNGKTNASKKTPKEEEDDENDDYEDMDDDEDDDDEDDEELDEEAMKKAIKKMKAELIDEEAEDSDDEDEGDDDDEEEEVQVAPSTKKRKLTNGNGKSEAVKSKEAKLTSPERTKKAPEQKTPKSQQPKKDTPKTPKSEKKTPAKPKFESIEDVKAAIKKFPGGKPRKQDKFGNWIENTFKVSDDSWKNELWNWHKKDIGL